MRLAKGKVEGEENLERLFRSGVLIVAGVVVAYVGLIVAANMGIDVVLPHWSRCAHPVSTAQAAKIVYKATARVKAPLLAEDAGTHWIVFQYSPPVVKSRGVEETVTVTEGGGAPEMEIDKCGGGVRVSYSR